MLEIFAAAILMAQDTPADWDDVLGTTIAPDWEEPIFREYDFWIGEWDANWRPREENGLDHVDDGRHTHQYVLPVLDGRAIMELAMPRDLEPGTAQGRGFSIRYFNEAAGRWVMAQHWPGPQNDGVAFLDQLTGEEHFGRVQVYGADLRRTTPDGDPQIRRYTFSDIREDAFRWDGANTVDRGNTWFTWMAVDFREINPAVDLPSSDQPLPGYHQGQLCTNEAHRAMDPLIGAWSGIAVNATGESQPASITAGRMLDGCGIVAVYQRPEAGYRSAVFYSWSPALERWYGLYLNNQRGENHRYYVGESAGEGSEFRLNPEVAIQGEEATYINHAQDDVSDSLQRLTWVEMGPDRVVFRVETRSAPDSAWILRWEYRLEAGN